MPFKGLTAESNQGAAAVFPYPRLLRRMVRQAMKDQAPNLYRNLKECGDLAKVVAMKATEMWEEYLGALEEPWDEVMRIQKLPFLEQIGELQAKDSRIVETILANHLEFADDDPPGVDNGSSS
jgi:hypothetical protein